MAMVFATGGPGVLFTIYRFVSERILGTGLQPVQFATPATVLPLGLSGGIVGGLLGSWLLRSMEKVGLQWDRLELGDKVTLFCGIIVGLIASLPVLEVGKAIDVQPQYRVLLVGGVTLGLCSLCIYALQSMADILPWNKGRRLARRSGIKILDTNVLIDGRIYDVLKTGFLEGQLYVPRFVLEELQYIADSHDALRRQRGRRGLEVLKHMQNEFQMDVGTHDKYAPDSSEEVDARIVRIATSLGADIVTNDFNLNRVASIQNIRVLSLNDLALSLRTNVLPQEQIHLKIIREGNQYGQGVGYLDDGTMVVVENGQPHIGETLDVTVTQVIQTERGKMIFAEVEGESEGSARRRSGSRSRNSA